MEQQSKLKKNEITAIHKQKFIPNNKILSNLIQSNQQTTKNTPQYINSFFYNDHITRTELPICKDTLLSTSKIRHSHKDNSGSNTTIKQCFQLMKSTRKFHLNSIQTRNYMNRNGNNCKENRKQDNLVDLIRVRVQKYYLNRKQQRQNFLKQKSALSKILYQPQEFHNQHHQSGYQIQQTALKSIQTNQQQLQPTNKKTSKINKVEVQESIIRKKIRDSLQKHETYYSKMEKQILKVANSQLRYFVRKNGQFLVTPKLSKRLIIKKKQNQYERKSLYVGKVANINESTIFQDKSLDRGWRDAATEQTKYFKKQQLSPYLFKNCNFQQLENRLRFVQSEKPRKDQKNPRIIQAIQKGNHCEIQIQLSVNPLVLLTKQPKNHNNLLHICIMSNKEDIFHIILKKCCQHNIDLLSQKNKYGRNPIQLAKVLSFFKKKQLLSQLAQIQKEKIKGALNAIGKFINKK